MYDIDSALELYSIVAVEIVSLALLSALTILLIRSARNAAHDQKSEWLSPSPLIFSASGVMYSIHYGLTILHTTHRIAATGSMPNPFAIDTLGDTIPMVLWWADNALLFGLHHLLYLRLKHFQVMSNYGDYSPHGEPLSKSMWKLKYTVIGSLVFGVSWASVMEWAAKHGLFLETAGKESILELDRMRQESADRFKRIAPVLVGVLAGDLIVSSIIIRRVFASTLHRRDLITNVVLFGFAPLYLVYFLWRMNASLGVSLESSREASDLIGMAGRAMLQTTLLSSITVIIAPIQLGWPLQWFRDIWIKIAPTLAGEEDQDDTELYSLQP